jgi:hypothetical protein
MDSWATDHITSDLEKLTIRDKYHGGEHVHAANGSCMEISHVGHSTLHSPKPKIHPKNILHVPDASKSLVSVNRLTRDNYAFVEFHPDKFLIKEQQMRRTLLSGRCEGGLYPLTSLPSRSSSNKQVFVAVKSSVSVWHHRLGHASTAVVQQALSHHNISFSSDSNNKQICDAC